MEILKWNWYTAIEVNVCTRHHSVNVIERYSIATGIQAYYIHKIIELLKVNIFSLVSQRKYARRVYRVLYFKTKFRKSGENIAPNTSHNLELYVFMCHEYFFVILLIIGWKNWVVLVRSSTLILFLLCFKLSIRQLCGMR